MWRFLNNIPRAFRQYIHTPRPSAGVYLEEEERCSTDDKDKKSGCPFTGRKGAEEQCLIKRYYFRFTSGVSEEKDQQHNENECCGGSSQNKAGKKKDRKWWKSCPTDFWTMVQSSNRFLEAITLGTASVWGTETDKHKRKLRLLYRVLWALNGESRLGVKDQLSSTTIPSEESQENFLSPPLFTQKAIKDAKGAEYDAQVNRSASETLDSALEEFQSLCEEYTHRNESLLGIHAAEQGDLESAVQHLYTACSMGNTSACYNLGLCYENGAGVSKDLNKAKLYYSRAASVGHSLALYNLGLIYLAEKYQDSDHSDQGEKLQETDELEGQKHKGLQLLERAARVGLAEAQTYLGVHYMEEIRDPKKAATYFRAAADQNDSEGQYFLAICYEHGLGVEKNECRAAQLYSLSAGAGHATSLYNLAVFNENGLGGLPVDMVTATELYSKAAKLGVEQAKDRLEEIQSQSRAYQVNESMFESLYQLYKTSNKDEKLKSSSHISSRPLSPSLSSPTIFQDSSSSSLSSQDEISQTSYSGGQQNMFDFLSNDDIGVRFSLGAGVDEDSDLFMQKSVLEKATADGHSFSPSSYSLLHKSFTSPNLSIVECTV